MWWREKANHAMTMAASPFALLQDYPRLKVVGSFEELVMTPMRDGINALCWPRSLPGDFGEIVEKLRVGKGITSIDDACSGAGFERCGPGGA